jgi:mono/diheme cytochrome c family protein
MLERSPWWWRALAALLALLGACVAGPRYLNARALQTDATAAGSARSSIPPGGLAGAGNIINSYCVSCHNGRLKTAGLELDRLDLQQVAGHAEQWEKVVTKLRTGEMPPPGRPRPDAAAYREVAATLEKELDAAAAARPHPGRVPVHRLNRNEYRNAIRDLLGLEIDGRALLTSDEADQEGFDNVASVLSVSPALLENYLSAARTLSRLAVGDPAPHPVIDTFKISKALVQDERLNDDLPFGSQGGALVRHHFPLDAEYTIKVLLRRQEYDYIIGIGERHQLDFRLDGALVKRFSVGGEAKGMTNPENFAGNTQGDAEFEEYMHTADAHLEVRVPVKAGPHDVSVSFVRRFWEPEGVLQPPQTGFGRTTNEYYHGNPAVEFVSIGGPYGAAVTGDTPSRRKIFICGSSDKEDACARKILSTLAARAYRRPLTEGDTQTLLTFYKEGRKERDFDAGIRRGIERILAAPSFLFRVEREPDGVAAGSAYRLSDLDLASRLSFFLWSSIPDDELRDAAVRGKLNDPAALEQQVRRMLRDPRSKALVDNFASRWLELSKISGTVPDTELYPEFDENLREAMEQETKLFVGSQVRDNRSVMELLTADYSFLNERLATHYGIRNVYGNHFRRVTFTDPLTGSGSSRATSKDDDRRGGLLGQSSVLTVTSYPNRTSVTMRGRWLLANLLGAPPPPPPPDIPALKEAGAEGQPRSLRERMEMHRKNPACASCHQRMDPLGFALENFDAVGKWRTASDGAPIDASASFPDGTRFEGIAGLRALMVSHKEDFVRTLGAKLLAFAIGRGLDYHDMPAVRRIERDAAAADYSWSSIVTGIVKSTPFSMAVASGDSTTTTQDAAPRSRKVPQ